jgi:hypothetical protein
MRLSWKAKLPLAFLATLVLFVLLAELALRWRPPPRVELFRDRLLGTQGERVIQMTPENPVHPQKGKFELDPELGYRPILGGSEYGPHGTLWNDHHLEKRPGVRRLLFLGDSVTRRAEIVDALCALLGAQVECWNAGVVGYSSRQELDYYRRYCGELKADHVILTFHMNDFETTPVTFLDGDRMVAVYGRLGSSQPNSWLLKHSYLYRFAWSKSLEASLEERTVDLQREVEDALRGLKALVAERGAELTVLVLPWLAPPERWTESMVRRHEDSCRLFEELGVPYHAFLETLSSALAEGLTLDQIAEDIQHPTAEFGRRMARELLERGFVP